MSKSGVDTPPSDFDGAWKYALEVYFPDFVALLFPDAYAAVAWQQGITFRNTELQQLAPADQEGKQRVNWLAEVRRLDGTPALVLVHIEIQSQRDATFAERMFRYHARLFDTMRMPVASMAVLGDEVATWRPARFGYNLWVVS